MSPSLGVNVSRRVVVPLALLCLALVSAGPPRTVADDGDLERRVAELERQAAQAQTSRAATIFARNCAACHGSGGAGDAAAAADLWPKPRDLTSRDYRFRTTANGTLPRPEDLARTIRRGIPGSSMPAFRGILSDAEIDAVVGFVYGLQPEPVQAHPEALTFSALPEKTDELVSDGQALYLLTGCWRCHGVNGRGKGPSAKTLEDNAGNKIRATDFRRDPFKAGRTAQDVVRTLRTGLNGTPMPSYDEAMMIARGEPGDVASLEGQLSALHSRSIDRFLSRSPTRGEIEALSPTDAAALRDRRFAALAYYVLSLERRSGFVYRLFHEEPELEQREP